jgi:hypothetical protein
MGGVVGPQEDIADGRRGREVRAVIVDEPRPECAPSREWVCPRWEVAFYPLGHAPISSQATRAFPPDYPEL